MPAACPWPKIGVILYLTANASPYSSIQADSCDHRHLFRSWLQKHAQKCFLSFCKMCVQSCKHGLSLRTKPAVKTGRKGLRTIWLYAIWLELVVRPVQQRTSAWTRHANCQRTSTVNLPPVSSASNFNDTCCTHFVYFCRKNTHAM